MSLSFYLLVYSSLDLIPTIRLATPVGGISNRQRLKYASGRKAEDALSLISAKKVIYSAVEVMLQAAFWLTFVLKYDSPSPAA